MKERIRKVIVYSAKIREREEANSKANKQTNSKIDPDEKKKITLE